VPNCTSELKRFITSLPPGEPFSTTQFLGRVLSMHSRTSVDNALSKLVKTGILDRIASGVFVESEKRKAAYTNLEIAEIKARSSANQNSLAQGRQAESARYTTPEKTVFFSLGNSTKFRYQGEYINIKQVSAKKLQLVRCEIGAIVLSLWQNGKNLTDAAEIARTIAPLSRKELEEFIALAPCMPNWLSTRAKDAIGPRWQKIERELQQRNTAKTSKTAADRGHSSDF
jgi:hypothetical protein